MEKEQPEQGKRISPGDHLANERTYLAWIRTSIAIMAFGFVVVKFTLFIKQLSFVLGKQIVLPGKGYSAIIGILLVVLGGLMALLSFFRYRNIEQQLLQNKYFPSLLLTTLLMIAIVVICILLVLYLIPGI